MNRYRLCIIACLLLSVLGMASTALAQDDPRLDATLILEPIEAQSVGSRPTIHARLLADDGRGNPNKVLKLYVNGELIRQARTDDLGLASIRIGRDLPVGEYQVEVEFGGTAAYKSASASLSLTIRPIQLTVETVPPLANVRFTLDGERFVSNAEGIATLEISEPDTYQLEMLDVTDIQINEETRATFSRWADSLFEPNRIIEANRDLHLQVGFTTSHPIGLTFVDAFRNPVDATRVTSVTFKRSDGSYFTFEDISAQWMMATRVMRRKEGLEATPLLYSLESVMVDGTNAINRYQQRFLVEQAGTWTIELLLYSINIQASDAVFGMSVGKGIMLQYPDGHTEEFEFGENKEVFIPSLARGLYHVQVKGAQGMAPLTPIAMSKDQDVNLVVLSALDMGAGIALASIGALALLLYKRPHILRVVFGGVSWLRKSRMQPAAVSLETSGEAALALPADLLVPATPAQADSVVNVATLPTNGETWLVERFHPDGFKCPYCQHVEASITGTNPRTGLTIFRCNACQRPYSLYTGTPLERSQLTPEQSQRLLYDTSLDQAQLARELGLTKKTVERWQKRLRTAGELPGGESPGETSEALSDRGENE